MRERFGVCVLQVVYMNMELNFQINVVAIEPTVCPQQSEVWFEDECLIIVVWYLATVISDQDQSDKLLSNHRVGKKRVLPTHLRFLL